METIVFSKFLLILLLCRLLKSFPPHSHCHFFSLFDDEIIFLTHLPASDPVPTFPADGWWICLRSRRPSSKSSHLDTGHPWIGLDSPSWPHLLPQSALESLRYLYYVLPCLCTCHSLFQELFPFVCLKDYFCPLRLNCVPDHLEKLPWPPPLYLLINSFSNSLVRIHYVPGMVPRIQKWIKPTWYLTSLSFKPSGGDRYSLNKFTSKCRIISYDKQYERDECRLLSERTARAHLPECCTTAGCQPLPGTSLSPS